MQILVRKLLQRATPFKQVQCFSFKITSHLKFQSFYFFPLSFGLKYEVGSYQIVDFGLTGVCFNALLLFCPIWKFGFCSSLFFEFFELWCALCFIFSDCKFSACYCFHISMRSVVIVFFEE